MVGYARDADDHRRHQGAGLGKDVLLLLPMVVSAAAPLAYAWVISRRKPPTVGRSGWFVTVTRFGSTSKQTLDVLVDPSDSTDGGREWAPLPARYTRSVLHKYARLVRIRVSRSGVRLTCPSIATSRTCAKPMSSSRMAASDVDRFQLRL